MKRRKEQTAFCLMALVSILLGLAFYTFVYLPQRAELREKESAASELRREIEQVAAFQRSHPKPKVEAEAIFARETLLETMLPRRMDAGGFLAETERRAKEAALDLRGVSPETPVLSDGFARQRVTLSVRGDYFALLDFIFALEQQGRFVKIDALSGDVNDAGVFSGTLALWIYAREL